ncbi:SH3 domain-containing protein [Nonlabens arenilitoris]|nr:SH3 domain-containing protein [Nonlabens arenilitoris]
MRAKYYLLFIVVLLLHAFAKAYTLTSYDKECIYVIARNGLNMRDAAGPQGNIIEKLPYGTKLDWSPPSSTDKKVYVIDDGEKIEGYWVKVWRSVPYQELKGNPEGYVFSAYLDYHLKEIPERSLYLYNRFSIQEEQSQTYFESSYHIDKDTYNYSAYIDCYPWYDEHFGYHSASNNSKEMYISQPADTLKSFIKLELVDYNKVIKQKKKTDFDLDYSFQPELLPINKNESEHNFLKRYYLPLKNGDSLEIKAHTGEYPHCVEYIGELKKQNKYLVVADFEGLEYAWINQLTGERINGAFPKVSPNNRYGVSHEIVYYEDGAQIGISWLDANLKATKSLYINFQSWIVSSSLDDSFWISDNEIILMVHPIDNTIQEVEMDEPMEPQWHYLKLTIL